MNFKINKNGAPIRLKCLILLLYDLNKYTDIPPVHCPPNLYVLKMYLPIKRGLQRPVPELTIVLENRLLTRYHRL